jgi:hypothetical protein
MPKSGTDHGSFCLEATVTVSRPGLQRVSIRTAVAGAVRGSCHVCRPHASPQHFKGMWQVRRRIGFGGRIALWTSNVRFRVRHGKGNPSFAAHLAFYPASCYVTFGKRSPGLDTISKVVGALSLKLHAGAMSGRSDAQPGAQPDVPQASRRLTDTLGCTVRPITSGIQP